ncbi:MAG: hypothetical protein QOI15_645, partial [Pseudonocardiales bacterium]|nr:hypothetical protein [Pseudonocardiales bacterium]
MHLSLVGRCVAAALSVAGAASLAL